jgi:hypothetical protein
VVDYVCVLRSCHVVCKQTWFSRLKQKETLCNVRDKDEIQCNVSTVEGAEKLNKLFPIKFNGIFHYCN